MERDMRIHTKAKTVTQVLAYISPFYMKLL
jgi:hypothetical protein